MWSGRSSTNRTIRSVEVLISHHLPGLVIGDTVNRPVADARARQQRIEDDEKGENPG
jgi:hypothetical protein